MNKICTCLMLAAILLTLGAGSVHATVEFQIVLSGTNTESVSVVGDSLVPLDVVATSITGSGSVEANLDSFTYRILFPNQGFDLESNTFGAPFDNTTVAAGGFNGSIPWTGLPLQVFNTSDSGSPLETPLAADIYRTTASEAGVPGIGPGLVVETLSVRVPMTPGAYPIHLILVEVADRNGAFHPASAGADFVVEVLPPDGASFSPVKIAQAGRDTAARFQGGCERGGFGESAPDRYMDAGEAGVFDVSFQSNVAVTDLEVALEVVLVDPDSRADCPPGSNLCPDPDRANNLPAAGLTIANSPVLFPSVPALVPRVARFVVQVDDTLAGSPKIELLARFSSPNTPDTLMAFRTVLNVDEVSRFYSTDFPSGGVEFRDFNSNGILENPGLDGRFETIAWSDLTVGFDAGGAPTLINEAIQAPWSFDNNDGGFRSGLGDITTEETIPDIIALWGEDKNFNNQLDGACEWNPAISCERFPLDPISCFSDPAQVFLCIGIEDRDPSNAPFPLLDQNWSTEGGCGWQTRAPGTCSLDPTLGCNTDPDCMELGPCVGPPPPTGGAWHTGRIGTEGGGACLVDGDTPGQCQSYEVIQGASGERRWLELLLTPVVQKVDQRVDVFDDAVSEVEILDFAWNTSLDLHDPFATFSWELNNNIGGSVDLTGDGDFLASVSGPLGAVSGGNFVPTAGYPMFADLDGAGNSTNISREGDNACFFEGPGVSSPQFSLALPNDGSPFATANGPIRNMDITRAGGPDMFLETLEDRVGDSGTEFQGALGIMVSESDNAATPALGGFGATVDDVVLQWREFELGSDATVCTAGETRNLRADHDVVTGNITVTYEQACASDDNNLEYGPLASVSSYGYTGQECLIGNGGSHVFNPGAGDYFWVVVANDGVSSEGSYGADSTGAERPEDLTDPSCAFGQSLDGRCDLGLALAPGPQCCYYIRLVGIPVKCPECAITVMGPQAKCPNNIRTCGRPTADSSLCFTKPATGATCPAMTASEAGTCKQGTGCP